MKIWVIPINQLGMLKEMVEEEAMDRLQICEEKRDSLFPLFIISLGEDDHSQASS